MRSGSPGPLRNSTCKMCTTSSAFTIVLPSGAGSANHASGPKRESITNCMDADRAAEFLFRDFCGRYAAEILPTAVPAEDMPRLIRNADIKSPPHFGGGQDIVLLLKITHHARETCECKSRWPEYVRDWRPQLCKDLRDQWLLEGTGDIA